MRRILGFWLFVFSFFLFTGTAQAANKVSGYLFYGEGCPHCAKERAFLGSIKSKYPDFVLTEYEIYYNKENSSLLSQVVGKLNVEGNGVPLLIIGDKHYVGYAEGVTNRIIEDRIEECMESECRDVVGDIISDGVIEASGSRVPSYVSEENANQEIELPLWGKLNVETLSLPLITLILAGLDGFNPCAMWTLLFLISLLLGTKNRRRMWILGISFILVSALVYFLFLSAWLNLFLFVGYIVWVRVVIGVVAVGAGYHYLHDFYVNRNGGCSVMGDEKRQKIFARLQAITQKKQLILAVGGMIVLAILVNMVELVCSAGLPAIYTQVLSMSDLPSWQYYLYLLSYILIFMLDDLTVFVVAIITLKAVGVESKYARYSHLVGGILILVIGLLLLFKPELLMFG